jgi:hypothetical protein
MWRLPARPYADLLTDLHGLAERVRHGETVDIPSLTLWLADGHKVHGQLVHFSAKEGLILVKDPSTFDATYVALVQVRAVTVHYSEHNVEILAAAAPNADELSRRLQALLERMSVQGTLELRDFPENEAARRVLAQALKDLEAALRQMLSDPEQRESFTQAVKEIHVRPSPEGPDVERDSGVLTVLLGLDAGQLTALSPGRLKRALEKLL